MQPGDPEIISRAFATIGWESKPQGLYQRYLREETSGELSTLVAELDGVFVGYLIIQWRPLYEPFREAGIPEVKDLNVLPAFQRQGIASHLMDEAEAIVARRCAEIGIGVGMDMDYGPAQRMYILRGYVPDGRGLTVDGRQLRYAESVRVDDDLVLFLTKRLDTT